MARVRVHDRSMIRQFANGNRSTSEIARLAGLPVKFVQKVVLSENLPRRKPGPPDGEKNPYWKNGFAISKDGYLLFRCFGHGAVRKSGYVSAHRYLMEMIHGRILEKFEVVDHINGLTLDNRIENLRLYYSNGQHLADTLAGRRPQWSDSGFQKIKIAPLQRKNYAKVDTFLERRKSGDYREQQICRLHESLQINAIDLLKMELRRLKTLGLSHPSIEPNHLFSNL